MHCCSVNDILRAVSSIWHTWPFVQTINIPFKSISINRDHFSLVNLAIIVSVELYLFDLQNWYIFI